MKNSIKNIFIGLTIVGILGACSNEGTKLNDTETTASNKDKLIIGLDDTFAPMGFRDNNGELVGFDIDLAKDVGARIDKEIEFQSIDWVMKETELNANNIDMIWNGYTITDEREEKVDFSTPYMDNSQIIVVLEESSIQTKDDLEGKVVSAQQSSSALDAILNDTSGISDKFKNGEIIQFPSNNDVFNDLASGRSEAIVVDETLGRYYMKQNKQIAFRVLDDSFGEEEYAIGFRKEDGELRELINETLKEIVEDGTYDEIYSKWFVE